VTGTGNVYANQCPAGHYCPAGTGNPKTNYCPYSTFRKTLGGENVDSCGDCPSGYFCPETTGEPYLCPLGYYCDEVSEHPKPCPIGTFAPGDGLTRVEECVSCYGGRFCSQYALTEPEYLCDQGYYCIDKSMTPVPVVYWVGEVGNLCEAGGYCESGSKFPAPCTPGTYSTAVGLTAKTC
jgi:hypothetical protein